MDRESGPDFIRQLLEPAMTAEDIAAECGVTVAAVYHWASGRRAPSEKHQKILDKLAGRKLDWP